MVTAGDEGADLPSDPTINLDCDHDVAVRLVLAKIHEVEGCDGDVGAIDKR